MSALIMMAIGTFAGLAVAHSRMTNTVSKVDDGLADMTKIGKVTVLMPTLNEAPWVESAISSLRNQNISQAYPDYFEIVVADSESEDGTATLAQNLADRVITVPRGKLTAVDAALHQVDGDIIMAVDADSYYAQNYMNLMLKPFEDPEVVAVAGSKWTNDNVFEMAKSLYLESSIFSMVDVSDIWPKTQKLQGLASAYSRTAYFAVGGFDLSTNQQNLQDMMNEEEYGLWQKMKTVGKCVREMRASVLTSSRRSICDERTQAYCDQVAAGERF